MEVPGAQDSALEKKLDDGLINQDVTRALSRADEYAYNLQHPDGHWCGEFATGVFPTAEYVFFSQACGVDISKDAALFRKHILSLQNSDGSWGIAPDHPGDLSISAEAYLALRLLGLESECKVLQLARSFIRSAGGIAKVRVLTRIFFAQFGLIPWDAVPQLPAELALAPSQSPISIYTFWVAVRLSIVPLLIIRHHEPLYALPNGRSTSNDFLDELWLDPKKKLAPYGRPFLELVKSDAVGFSFKALDSLMYLFKSFRHGPLRYIARKKIVKWLLERQNSDGSWFGYSTGYQLTMQALLLEGFKIEDTPIRRGLAAIQTWMWEDNDGRRIQLSNSPVWDTAMMMKALSSSGHRDDERVQLAAHWCKANQLFGPKTDLAQYCPDLPSGGFAFEYCNPWYPDVDDTAAVALSMLDQDPGALEKFPFIRATEFLLGMQNADGGWAAFDRDRDPSWLHKSPFNDMDNLCDPSTADITGRVLELCGLVIRGADAATGRSPPDLVYRAQRAAQRAIPYLAAEQEADGSWWGRWGINYVFGTCNAIGGLALFADADGKGSIAAMVQRGAAFLKRIQHSDGGWGESYATYDIPPAPPGSGASLPSPTAWALLGLLSASVAPDDPAICGGVRWLLREQTKTDSKGGLSWFERPHTGVGFPRKLYIGYKLYEHYFPLMALGQYMTAVKAREVKKG
ncbi:MAG: hypothetical protein M1835_006663 [Candelina submexicana]|nr:MAG: hypothetical protein M1835_006663 [Candelina submexicana]